MHLAGAFAQEGVPHCQHHGEVSFKHMVHIALRQCLEYGIMILAIIEAPYSTLTKA